MANWVYNAIRFKEKDKEKFLQYLEQGNFDFNKLAKMPKELEEMGGDHGEVEGIAKEWKDFTRDVKITPANVDEYVEKFKNEVRENPEKYPEAAKTVNLEIKENDWGGIFVPDFQYQMYRIAGKVKYGFESWLDWRSVNWGTTREAWDTVISDEILSFTTVWETPLPIFEKIAEFNPDTWFQVKYYDEALGGNCGIIEYRPYYFSVGEYDNMAIVEYNSESKELKIVKTAYFENSQDAPQVFNATIATNSHGTFIHYNDWTDYRRFIDKLTADEDEEYFRKWYIFADGNLEFLEEDFLDKWWAGELE